LPETPDGIRQTGGKVVDVLQAILEDKGDGPQDAPALDLSTHTPTGDPRTLLYQERIAVALEKIATAVELAASGGAAKKK